jgi:ABC-2 type transport system ATP-binding protein
VRALITEMADRKALLLTTHILEEVEAVCTRAVVIARGRIVADGTPLDLQGRSRLHNAVRLGIRGDRAEVIPTLEALPGSKRVETMASDDGIVRCRVFSGGGDTIVAEVSRCIRERQWELDELHVEVGRLDEVFRDLTTPGGAA